MRPAPRGPAWNARDPSRPYHGPCCGSPRSSPCSSSASRSARSADGSRPAWCGPGPAGRQGGGRPGPDHRRRRTQRRSADGRQPHLVAGHPPARRRPVSQDARQVRDPAVAGRGSPGRARWGPVHRTRPAARPAGHGRAHRRAAARRCRRRGLPRGQHLVRPGTGALPAGRLPGRAGRRGAGPAGASALPVRPGTASTAPAFVGDDSLLASLWRVVSARGLVADVEVRPALTPGSHADRRDLPARRRETRVPGRPSRRPSSTSDEPSRTRAYAPTGTRERTASPDGRRHRAGRNPDDRGPSRSVPRLFTDGSGMCTVTDFPGSRAICRRNPAGAQFGACAADAADRGRGRLAVPPGEVHLEAAPGADSADGTLLRPGLRQRFYSSSTTPGRE